VLVPLASVIAGAFLLVGVAAAVMPGPLTNIRSVDNPLGVDLVAGPSHAFFFLAGPFMLVALAVGFVALGLRFRRSRGVERQQLKWLAHAASCAPLATVNSFIPVLGTWSLLAMWAVFYAIAGAIGVAILRYRLYDIDLLINRTLVYAALTAVVVAVYVGVVGYLGALLRTQDNLAVSLVAPVRWRCFFSHSASGCSEASIACCTASATSRTPRLLSWVAGWRPR
jgi:hypothetical protein